jgi:putative effector of murein hydrolase
MLKLLTESTFFCGALTFAAFYVGAVCQKKWKSAVFNPILIGACLVMLTLWALDVPVEQYQAACQPLTYLITPATVCLVIACYKQLQKLKEHMLAIFIGVIGGTLASLLSVGLLC